MRRILVLKPGKEYVILRKARKAYICHDSGRIIDRGDYYIEDHINYITKRRDGSCFLKWYVNKISLSAWKGIIP